MAKIEFKTKSAAFEDKKYEIARILREIADDIESGRTRGTVMDINGNKVGTYSA